LRSNTKDYGGKTDLSDSQVAIQLHLLAENCTICSSRSRRPGRKLLDTPSYFSNISVDTDSFHVCFLCYLTTSFQLHVI